MNKTVGTCSICGGRVTVPHIWGGVMPPTPTCDCCGNRGENVREMNKTTQTNFNNRPLTVEDVLLAVEQLKAIPQNDKWLIVDPQGNVVIGKYMEVAHFFLRRHPMLEMPTTSVPFDWAKQPEVKP